MHDGCRLLANRRVMIPSRCRLQERFKRPGSIHQSTRVETKGWEKAREEEGKRTVRLTKICVMPCTALKVRCCSTVVSLNKACSAMHCRASCKHNTGRQVQNGCQNCQLAVLALARRNTRLGHLGPSGHGTTER